MYSYTVKKLDNDYSEQALTLVSEEFSHGSPLHQAMDISQQEYFDYLSADWHNYAMAGPLDSLIAIDSNSHELLGCLITSRFPVVFCELELLPEKQQPISALLQKLESNYLKSSRHHGKGCMVDLVVVRKTYRGTGIYQHMRKTLHTQAKAAGYDTVFGELSSASTQHVCVKKLGHKVLAEINYDTFDYRGNKPFASIENPPSIQLVGVFL